MKKLLVACAISCMSILNAQDFSGFYKIVPKANEKFQLDVKSKSLADEAELILWTKNNGLNQEFAIIPNGQGYFTIISRHSGKSIDVKGHGTNNGAPVIQYKAHGKDNQLWKLEDAGDGFYKIKCKQTGKCLDAEAFQVKTNQKDGAKVIQWDDNNGDNQKWKFVK